AARACASGWRRSRRYTGSPAASLSASCRGVICVTMCEVYGKNKSGVAGRTATPLRYGDRPESGPFGEEARTDAVRVVVRGGAGVRLLDAIRLTQPTTQVNPPAAIAAKRQERKVRRAGRAERLVAD